MDSITDQMKDLHDLIVNQQSFQCDWTPGERLQAMKKLQTAVWQFLKQFPAADCGIVETKSYSRPPMRSITGVVIEGDIVKWIGEKKGRLYFFVEEE